MKMGEREVVITIEVTKIYRGVPEEFDNDKVQCGENIRKKVEKALDADNVVVSDVHEIQLQGLRDQMDDGWIPCSEKLPLKPENNMLFENKPLELYLATVKDSDYAWRVFWNGEYFTDGWNKVDVIAWQELPKVYNSKEGES